MNKRKLGRSDLMVSAIGMGCWAIGGPWWYVNSEGEKSPSGWSDVDDAESIRAIDCALDMGVNFFDTADAYGCGHSEVILGKALHGKRDQVVITTKFGKQFDEEKKLYFGHETSPELIRQACENSLRRLGTDYIDLYQFHWGDFDGDAVEVRETLEVLVDEGKIRYYGWSTDDPDHARIFAAGEHCTAMEHALFVFHKNPTMLSVCEEFDLASINRGPLAMGLLTGKFDENTTFPDDDIRNEWNFKEGGIAARLKQVEAIRNVLTSDGRTLAQGALCWILALNERTIPIPGFETVKQVKENAGALEFQPLSTEQMRQIDEILERN